MAAQRSAPEGPVVVIPSACPRCAADLPCILHDNRFAEVRDLPAQSVAAPTPAPLRRRGRRRVAVRIGVAS